MESGFDSLVIFFSLHNGVFSFLLQFNSAKDVTINRVSELSYLDIWVAGVDGGEMEVVIRWAGKGRLRLTVGGLNGMTDEGRIGVRWV